MESPRYFAIVWSTMPVVGRTTTWGPAARAPDASNSQPSAITAREIRGIRRRPRGDTVMTTSALSIAPRRGTPSEGRPPSRTRPPRAVPGTRKFWSWTIEDTWTGALRDGPARFASVQDELEGE